MKGYSGAGDIVFIYSNYFDYFDYSNFFYYLRGGRGERLSSKYIVTVKGESRGGGLIIVNWKLKGGLCFGF